MKMSFEKLVAIALFSSLQDELERDKRITWIVTFYAAWSPQSVTFAPIFSEISSQYVHFIDPLQISETKQCIHSYLYILALAPSI